MDELARERLRFVTSHDLAHARLKFPDEDEAEQVMGELELNYNEWWLRHGATEEEARAFERGQQAERARIADELRALQAKCRAAEKRADAIVEMREQEIQCNLDGTHNKEWTVGCVAEKLGKSASYITRQCRAGEFNKDIQGKSLKRGGARQNGPGGTWVIPDIALKAYAERRGIWKI